MNAVNHLTIDYPEELPFVLQESREEFEQEAKTAMALKLFEMKRISSGIAASLIGMDRVSFLLLLHRYGIPMINETTSEIESDLNNA
jgi:predicted HTH domain antitoxin